MKGSEEMKRIMKCFSDNYLTFCLYALLGWIYEVSWFLIFQHKFINRGVLFGPFLPIYGFGMLILLLLLKRFMSKQHLASNKCWLTIASLTVVSFIYVTIIEYTTPKIYDVGYFLGHYGLGLLLVNVIGLVISFLFIKNKKIDVTMILVFLLIWIIATAIEFVSHYVIDVYFHQILWDYSKDFLNIDARVNWDASRNFAIGGTILLYTVQPLLEKVLNKTSLNVKFAVSLIILIPMIIDFIL